MKEYMITVLASEKIDKLIQGKRGLDVSFLLGWDDSLTPGENYKRNELDIKRSFLELMINFINDDKRVNK